MVVVLGVPVDTWIAWKPLLTSLTTLILIATVT